MIYFYGQIKQNDNFRLSCIREKAYFLCLFVFLASELCACNYVCVYVYLDFNNEKLTNNIVEMSTFLLDGPIVIFRVYY